MRSILAIALLGLACSAILPAIAQPSRFSDPPGAFATQPVRVLVLFPSGAKRPSEARLLKRLKKLPHRGWQVSVGRADGSLTGFVRSRALPGALKQNAPDQDSHAEIDAAVRELLRDPQHSVLLFASKVQPEFQAPSWTAALVRKRVPVYVIDGGQWTTVQLDAGQNYLIDDLIDKKVRRITGGILHEVNLAGAVKDIVMDRKNGFTFLYAQPD